MNINLYVAYHVNAFLKQIIIVIVVIRRYFYKKHM